ncbi:MAG: PD-(D/E)XK nuclease family protein [Bacilli bacterium]
MEIEKYLDKEAILIVPREKKKSILKKLSNSSSLYQVKVMTIDELIRKYYFDYTEETIFSLVKDKNINPSTAKMYLDNLYFIKDQTYLNPKLKELVSLKEELKGKGLLTYTPSFKSLLCRTRVIVLSSKYLKAFDYTMLKEIEALTEVIYLKNEVSYDKEIEVLEFNTIDDEVHYIITKIIELNNNNIPFSKIHLLNVTSEYNVILPRLFKLFHIPLDMPNSSSLYGTVIGQKFLNLILNNISLEITLKELENSTDKELLNQLITICNKYVWHKGPAIELYPLLVEELKNSLIVNSHLFNAVTVDSLYGDYKEDDYCFILGFNEENLPNTVKDEDYLNDKEKVELNLDTVEEINKREKEHLLDFIYYLDNLIITYKNTTPFSIFYPSSLIKNLNFSVIKKEEEPLNIIYSDLDSQLTYASKLDTYFKYGTLSKNIDKLNKHYPSFPYLTYNNNFTSLTKESLYKHINNKLLLSYSSLDNYYHCAFRYYASNILKLDTFDETFAIKVGTIFHYILSICFSDNFDLEETFTKTIMGTDFTKKELFFLVKLKEELGLIIKVIKNQNSLGTLNKALYEHKIYIKKDRDIPVTFMGIVDKILYEEQENTTNVAIIDYKTGNPETSLFNSIYGLDMQLPIYLYLVKHSELFKNVKFVGFYLQKILHNEITIKLNKTYLEQKESSLKLMGYSNSQEYLIEKIDKDYQSSKVIQGMRLSSKGFYNYTKVLNDMEIENLDKLVDEKIDKAIASILNSDFSINPKVIGTTNVGCKFCPFKELCYMTDKNLVYLDTNSNLDFLRGDKDAKLD